MRQLSDFKIGQQFQAGPIEVSEAEIVTFAERYDPQPFHTDPLAAKKTFFRGLAASGWLTASLTMRLIVASGFDIKWGLIGREVESLKWLLPVRAGDHLRATSEIIEVTPSPNRPDRGWIRFRTETFNQKDEIVQSMFSSALVPHGVGNG